MKALIRNCLHGSEIYLLEEIGAQGQVEAIWKSTASHSGINDLSREMAGAQWYNQRISRPIGVVVSCKTTHYLALKYEFIAGLKASYKDGYYPNRKWIASIIDHYCSIWGGVPFCEDELYPLHGDFSLDNVIFSEMGPVIIDWEHFSEKAVPLGFDGLYLLFESLWFESKNRNPDKRSIQHLAEMIQVMLDRKCMDNQLLKNTLSKMIKFIESHLHLWGGQLLECKNKLPILMFNSNVIANIDMKIEGVMKLEAC